MKILLLLLLPILGFSQGSFETKFKNFKDCPYKITLFGYNDQIYKVFYLKSKEEIIIKGSVPYPYFKILFQKSANVDCGCNDQDDCKECGKTEKIWQNKNKTDFIIFLETNETFYLTRNPCGKA